MFRLQTVRSIFSVERYNICMEVLKKWCTHSYLETEQQSLGLYWFFRGNSFEEVSVMVLHNLCKLVISAETALVQLYSE